jgi:hypothetical protein
MKCFFNSLLALIVSGVVIYYAHYYHKPQHYHVSGTYDGCSECSQTAKDLAWSLDNESELWKADSFDVERSDYVCIWYANQEYGLSAGRNSWSDNTCSAWEPNNEDRALLYRAYNRWAEKSILGDKK